MASSCRRQRFQRLFLCYEDLGFSLDISRTAVSAYSIGAFIALHERAVGFHDSLVNINACHQPGVEAGKKAATIFLQLQAKVRAQLSPTARTAEQIARALESDPEDVFHTLKHLAGNEPAIRVKPGLHPGDDEFSLDPSGSTPH